MAHRLVLDTSVLVAGLRSRLGASYQVLRMIESGQAVPVLTVPLLLEYEDVLKREPGVFGLSPDRVDALLDDLCALGEHREIHFVWRPTLRDPQDELVLEAAVAANGPPIVTHNVRDFVGSESLGVAVHTPSEWLRLTGGYR